MEKNLQNEMATVFISGFTEIIANVMVVGSSNHHGTGYQDGPQNVTGNCLGFCIKY